jgi:hypothetical protein
LSNYAEHKNYTQFSRKGAKIAKKDNAGQQCPVRKLHLLKHALKSSLPSSEGELSANTKPDNAGQNNALIIL